MPSDSVAAVPVKSVVPEESTALGSPCRLMHLGLWSSEAEKSKIMCWGKGTMVPCTVIPGVIFQV